MSQGNFNPFKWGRIHGACEISRTSGSKNVCRVYLRASHLPCQIYFAGGIDAILYSENIGGVL